jgi:hypothetical protein
MHKCTKHLLLLWHAKWVIGCCGAVDVEAKKIADSIIKAGRIRK